MTVEELIEKLRAFPATAALVFRHDRDDLPDEYDAVDVFYDRGEVFVDIHSAEETDNG